MFTFGFSNPESDNDKINETNPRHWFKAEHILPESVKNNIVDESSIQNFNCKHVFLKYVSSKDALNHIKKTKDDSNCILKAESDHSDLITAEYEGGLKIWECTIDLINFLGDNKISFENKKVLDLGCGAGMLGLYTFLNGSFVDFQDYNKEVIEYTTIPNVMLNVDKNAKNFDLKKCNFYSGDWKSFMELTTTKYDYILTSETIYNPENYQKLLDLFRNKLNDNGTIYLAAKTYYFGVGGGIRQFEELINRGNTLESSVCWKCTEGVQREILKIIKK